LFVFQPDDVLTHRGGAEERGDVAGDTTLFQIAQVFRQRVPFNIVLDVFLSRTYRAFIRSFSGPIELPSPMISVVTPWRISLCDLPS
jgi:hypothetical protein